MRKLYTTVLLIFTLMILARAAHAEAVLGSDKANAVFKADGKIVSAVEAVKLAPNHLMERCTSIKGAQDVNGNEVAAVKCKIVVLEYNPKTGIPHWRTK